MYKNRMDAETAKMSPMNTQEIMKGIYAIRDDYVNLYIYQCTDGYIAVDAGINQKHVQAELEKMGIDPKHVNGVFLTHTDTDHTGAIHLFTNADIFISRNELQMVNGKTKRAFIFSNRMDLPFQILEDGQIIEVAGCNIKSIATPGHTPGSMTYLINSKDLFTGDTISIHRGKIEPFNDFLIWIL